MQRTDGNNEFVRTWMDIYVDNRALATAAVEPEQKARYAGKMIDALAQERALREKLGMLTDEIAAEIRSNMSLAAQCIPVSDSPADNG